MTVHSQMLVLAVTTAAAAAGLRPKADGGGAVDDRWR